MGASDRLIAGIDAVQPKPDSWVLQSAATQCGCFWKKVTRAASGGVVCTSSANLQSTQASTLTANLQKVPHAKPRQKSASVNEIDYQRKLARIKSDLRSGAIDRLTLAIGRDRYSMRDLSLIHI